MAQIPEISTAWVTLAATTRGMEADIRRAVTRASGASRIDPRVNTSGLNSQASRAGREFGDRFSSSAKSALKALSAVTIGVGLVDQFKKVLDVGMDWTNSLNTLQAVTGATADQLKQAGAAARALGNDISLPATSANDAAAAMTELAKGGFTVQQSMDAAKGSLQLAAAAQIGAADAATIQSQALQAFGLQASDAGKIADTLANAANASSAEITDVAQALAQAGTVANQFGLSAQDTAAAIALLANNGIKGADAGTLLKSSLLALTDQGNPAQGAIEQLGLTVYDTQGKFVGLHELFRQLGVASHNMTPEMYQAATATLFGSDAMRLAGVAAKDGSAGYDAMRTSIDRQGAAADVAAAKTKGLPGAWERVKNALESLQLNTYDAIEGPLTKAADFASTALGRIPEAFKQLRNNPAVQSAVKPVGEVFKSIVSTAKDMAPAIVQIIKSLGTAAGTIGVVVWKGFVTVLQAAAGALQAIAPLVAGIAGFMKNQQGLVTAAFGAWLLFKTVPALMGRVATSLSPVTTAVQNMNQRFTAARTGLGNFGSAYGTYMGYVRQANPGISTAAANLRTLGGVASSAASGGLNAIRGAASGVVGALGGAFSAALIGAGVAFALISAKNQQASQSLKAYQDAVRATGQAQVAFNEALERSGGALDDSVKPVALDRIKSISTELDAASKRTGSFADKMRDTSGSILGGLFTKDVFFGSDNSGSLDAQIGRQADAAKSAQKAIDDLKLSQQSLTDVAYGGQDAFDALVSKLDAAGEGGRQAADQMRTARKEFQDSQAAAKNLTPGFVALRDAIKTIADASSSAADKTNAFKAALDTLAGVQPNVQQATDNYNTTIRQVAAATQEAADASKGMGSALIGANGSVNTATENGHALFDALNQIKDSTAEVAGAGGDLKSALSQNDTQLTGLANKFGLTKSQVDAMAAAMGYVPRNIQTLFDIEGLDETGQQVATVTAQLNNVPPGKTITLDGLDKGAMDLLKNAGVKLREIDVNGHKQVEITAPNGEVLAQLQQVIDKLAEVKRSQVLNFDTGSFANAGDAQRARQGHADGAIVPMASGGFRQINKPGSADIYAGRGAGTIFAEQETGGEAYIPLAAAKRSRSKRILSEVARLFGMNVMADGAITIDTLKEFASNISGGGYVRGGPPGLSGTDCSGAQADIANFITGGSGRFSTATEAQALLSRGFQTGDPPPGVSAYWVGWKNGGPGGGHTAGTIVDPLGGNVNVEMGGANGGGAFGAGASGAAGFPNRAWIQIAGGEDPNAPDSFGASSAKVQSATAAVTSARGSVTSAQASLDQANAAVADAQGKGASADKVATLTKKRDAAQTKLDAATQRQAAAETKLADVKEKAAGQADKTTGGTDVSSLGQSLFSGVLQGIGLDGSVFSNPFEWPNVKSAMALANFGGGLLKGTLAQDDTDTGGGGGFGIPGLPSLTGLIKPMGGPQVTNLPDSPHAGTGAPPGPLVAYNGTVNMGVDPRAHTQRQAADMNQAWRKSGMNAVRPQ